jgi:hypothetical protein
MSGDGLNDLYVSAAGTDHMRMLMSENVKEG